MLGDGEGKSMRLGGTIVDWFFLVPLPKDLHVYMIYFRSSTLAKRRVHVSFRRAFRGVARPKAAQIDFQSFGAPKIGATLGEILRCDSSLWVPSPWSIRGSGGLIHAPEPGLKHPGPFCYELGTSKPSPFQFP